MRGGLEIIDTDQHVGPNMETLHKYAGPRLLRVGTSCSRIS